MKEICHPKHPKHKLRLEYTETPFNCDGCKEAGIGLKYRCRCCEFDLHKVCATARHVITHPFYDQCEFRLHYAPPGPTRRACDACRNEVSGFVYHCSRCGFDLHPCCANLPRVLDDGERALYLYHKLPGACHKCGVKGGKGWAYRSGCGAYSLHVSCVKELLLESWQAVYLKVDKNKARQIQTQIPTLGETLKNNHRNGGRGGRVKKCCEIAGGAIRVVVSAILGDPTAIIGAVVAGLISSK